MNDIVSPVQSMSYTDKDFVSVYQELLDLTKELTALWDPSISNESDPGVILLKLNAVIADKCNYSIDKSILECFPLSVTQESNARQLFEQLGYYMHWYKAATTDVFIKWIGDPSAQVITIPKFTMVTDANNTIVYSLLGPSESSITGGYNISDQSFRCDSGEGITFKAIQGVAVNYDINGETLITAENLDLNNRLYFSDLDVAENGIFIRNASSENYTSWVKKDNLLVESLGNTFYKFGVTKDLSYCYIEFPEDASEIMQEGIYITYIRTAGQAGNISPEYLSKFYNFNTVIYEDSVLTIDETNVLVQNASAALNGESTETINSAYRGYKRTVGTFDTLITLRDYINYINNSGLVSNGFICDRTNDLQTVHKVMTSLNDVDQTVNIIEDVIVDDITNSQNDSINATMNAFSLRLYLLTYVDQVTTDNYLVTFEVLDNDKQNSIKEYVNDTKAINHEFLDLLSPTETHSHICYFKNVCPIACTIIPQSKLTASQILEVRNNIREALVSVFNSKQINFGDKFPYELIQSTIVNADSRIKSISELRNINYITYAVYRDDTRKLTYTTVNGNNVWLNNEWNEEHPADYGLNPKNPIPGAVVNLPTQFIDVNLTNENDIAEIYSNNKSLQFNIDESAFINELGIENCYAEQLFECVDITDVYDWTLNGNVVELMDYGISYTGDAADGSEFDVEYERTLDDGSISSNNPNLVPSLDQTTFKDKMGAESGTLEFKYQLVDTNPVWELNDEEVDIADYGISIIGFPSIGDKFKARLSHAHQFRNEIYVKSVLAGITQFFIKDETFDYKLNNKYKNRIDNISSLWSNVDIEFNLDSALGINNTIYTLKPNEALQFYSPNLIDKDSYSNYVKFEYKINSDIRKNTVYQLNDNEYIIFYWKDSDLGVYQYRSYGKDTIIYPNFELEKNEDLDNSNIADNPNYYLLNSSSVNIDGTITYSYQGKSSYEYGDMSPMCSAAVSNLTSSYNNLSDQKIIKIKEINTLNITSQNNYGIYWILNNPQNDKYVLFNENESYRILNTGELLLITNPSFTNVSTFGVGTSIQRDIIDSIWQVDVIDAEKYSKEGISALNGKYFNIPSGATMTVTENSFTTIGGESDIQIAPIYDGNNTAKYLNTLSIDISRTSTSTLEVEDLDMQLWENSRYSGIGSHTFTYTLSNDTWKDENNNVVNLSTLGFTINDTVLKNNDKIFTVENLKYNILFSRDSYDIQMPEGDNVYRIDENPSLADFSIQYRLPTDETWTKLNTVNLINKTSWQGRSLLGINISSNQSQILYENQTIHYTLANQQEYIVIPYKQNLTSNIIIDSFSFSAFTHTKYYDAGNTSYVLTYKSDQSAWYINYEEAGTSEQPVVLTLIGINLNSNSVVQNGDKILLTTSYFIEGSNLTYEMYDLNIPSEYPCCLMSSFDVAGDGGSIINTKYTLYDINNDFQSTDVYLSLYEFGDVKNLPLTTSFIKPQKFIFNDYGSCNFYFTQTEESSVNDQFMYTSLPQGNYILAVKNYESGLNNVHVDLDGINLNCMYDHQTNNLSEPGEYYLYMSITDEYNDSYSCSEFPIDELEFPLSVTVDDETFSSCFGNGTFYFQVIVDNSATYKYRLIDNKNNVLYPNNLANKYKFTDYGIVFNRALGDDDIGTYICVSNEHKLNVHVEDHTVDCSIQISNCYKYEFPEGFSDTKNEFIEKWISYFDPNHVFKYNYEVPESVLIENPLTPLQFFNTNHIYNSYTIGCLGAISIKIE